MFGNNGDEEVIAILGLMVAILNHKLERLCGYSVMFAYIILAMMATMVITRSNIGHNRL